MTFLIIRSQNILPVFILVSCFFFSSSLSFAPAPSPSKDPTPNDVPIDVAVVVKNLCQVAIYPRLCEKTVTKNLNETNIDILTILKQEVKETSARVSRAKIVAEVRTVDGPSWDKRFRSCEDLYEGSRLDIEAAQNAIVNGTRSGDTSNVVKKLIVEAIVRWMKCDSLFLKDGDPSGMREYSAVLVKLAKNCLALAAQAFNAKQNISQQLTPP